MLRPWGPELFINAYLQEAWQSMKISCHDTVHFTLELFFVSLQTWAQEAIHSLDFWLWFLVVPKNPQIARLVVINSVSESQKLRSKVSNCNPSLAESSVWKIVMGRVTLQRNLRHVSYAEDSDEITQYRDYTDHMAYRALHCLSFYFGNSKPLITPS